MRTWWGIARERRFFRARGLTPAALPHPLSRRGASSAVLYLATRKRRYLSEHKPPRHPERRAKPVVELLRVEGVARTSKSARSSDTPSRIYEGCPIALHNKCYFPYERLSKLRSRSLRRSAPRFWLGLLRSPPQNFDYGLRPSLRMTTVGKKMHPAGARYGAAPRREICALTGARDVPFGHER